MLDTDTACVVAGMAAIGAILWSRNPDMAFYPSMRGGGMPTPCSAMKASVTGKEGEEETYEDDGVFAMKGEVEEQAEGSDPFSSLFPATSQEFEKQYEGASATPSGNFYSKKVQDTINELRPKYIVETNFSNTLGNCVPVPGRDFEHCKPKKVKVEGGCMLYQTEAYAEQVEAQREEA